MERSNRNKNLQKPLILGVSALVLIAAGGGYYAYSQWQAKQELAEAKKTATTFLNVLSKQEFDKLPSVVQEASLKKNGYDTKSVVEKYQAIYSGIQAEGVKASDVQVKKAKDNQYTFTYKLSMSTPLGEMKDLSYQSSIAKKAIPTKSLGSRL